MSNDDASARRFQGQRATFVSLKGSDEVEMRVGHRTLALATADWLCLPPLGRQDATGGTGLDPGREAAAEA